MDVADDRIVFRSTIVAKIVNVMPLFCCKDIALVIFPPLDNADTALFNSSVSPNSEGLQNIIFENLLAVFVCFSGKLSKCICMNTPLVKIFTGIVDIFTALDDGVRANTLQDTAIHPMAGQLLTIAHSYFFTIFPCLTTKQNLTHFLLPPNQ